MPTIGTFRHRVSIQTKTETADTHGGFTESWSTVQSRLAARVVVLTGRELERAKQIDPRATHEVSVRYWRAHNDSLKGGRARVIWHDDGAVGNRTLEVVGPPRETLPRTWLVLTCKEAR